MTWREQRAQRIEVRIAIQRFYRIVDDAPLFRRQTHHELDVPLHSLQALYEPLLLKVLHMSHPLRDVALFIAQTIPHFEAQRNIS